MMRKSFLLLALLCLPLAPRAQADDVSDARQAIQAAYDRESDAWARKDVPALIALGALPDPAKITMKPIHVPVPPGLSPDEKRQLASNERQMNARLDADMRNMVLKAILENTTFLSGVATVQNLSLNGQTALVTAKMHGVLVKTDPKTHQDKTLVTDNIVHDTWRQTAKGWKRAGSKTVWQQQTLNGKPVPLDEVK